MDVSYPEGSDVGYRLYAKTGRRPLFPFGYGLTYTSFAYRDLTISPGPKVTASLEVVNTGAREGTDVAQVYLSEAPHRRQQRLLGWARVTLKPGERRRVTVEIDPRLLSDWDEALHGWRRDAGDYRIAAGASSADLPLTRTVRLAAETRRP